MSETCQGCGSSNIRTIDYYQTQIALDDIVDWEHMECVKCGREWDR